MKAKVMKANGIYKLYSSNGKIFDYDINGIKEFMSNYRNDEYYKVSNIIHFVVKFDDLEGDTIAYVNDKFELCIVNESEFKKILNHTEFNYVSASEYAEMYNKSVGLIKRYCRENRIPGVVQISDRFWLIPKDAEYPKDERLGRRVGKY